MEQKPTVIVLVGLLGAPGVAELIHAVHDSENGARFSQHQNVAGEPPHTHDREPFRLYRAALTETIVGSTATAPGVMPANAGLPFPWAIRIR